jgi:hypothetical protein
LYCCTKESHSDDNPALAQKSSAITAARGVEIELSSPEGDEVTLIIPGYALEDSVQITYPFNPPQSDFEVRFPMEDYYIVLGPVPGGPTGNFKWILHLQV